MAVYGGDYVYAARKGGDGDDIPWDEPLELRNILNASAVVKITKWKDVGLELGVEKHVLEIIDQDCRGITNDCKREMFSHWLENDCQPSWDKVNRAVNLVRNRLEEGSRLEEIIKSLKSDVNSLGRFDEAEKQDLIRQLTELTNIMRECTAPIDDCDQAPHEEEKNFRDFQLHLTWLIQYFMQVSEGALQRYVEQLKQRKSKSSYYWLIMLATTWLVQGLLIGIAVLISFQSGTIIFLIMVTLIILVATNEIYESRKENSNLEINQKLDNDTKIEKAMKHKFKQVKKTVECQFTKNECPIQYPPSDSSPHSPSKPSSPPSSNHTFHTSADDSSHPSAGHPPSSSNSSQPFTNCCFCSTTDPLSYPSSENCPHSSSGNFSHPSSDAPSHSSSDPPSHSSSDPPSHPSSDPPAHPSSDPSSQPSSDSSHPFSDPPSDPFLDTPFPSFSDPLFSPFSDPPFPSLSNPLFRPSHHFSCDSSHPSSDSSHPSSDSSHPFSDPPSHPSLDPLSHSSSDPPSQPSSDPPSKPSSDPPSQPSSDPPSQPSSDPPSQPSSDPPSQSSSDPLSQPSLESSSHPFSDPPAHPFTDTPLPSFSDPLFSHFSDPPFCPSPIPPPSHSSSCNSFHSSSCSSSHSSSSNSSHSSSSNSSQSSLSNFFSGILNGVFRGLIYKYLDIYYNVLVLALIFCILIIIYYVAYKRLCNRN